MERIFLNKPTSASGSGNGKRNERTKEDWYKILNIDSETTNGDEP